MYAASKEGPGLYSPYLRRGGYTDYGYPPPVHRSTRTLAVDLWREHEVLVARISLAEDRNESLFDCSDVVGVHEDCAHIGVRCEASGNGFMIRCTPVYHVCFAFCSCA